VRFLRVATCAVVVTIGLSACSGGDEAGSARSSRGTTTSPAATTSPGTGPGSATATAFVGLRKRAAIDKAEGEGRPWRIGREDDEQFGVTQDFVENRVTFEIDDGTVTKATFG
jgi:hypothetical protein